MIGIRNAREDEADSLAQIGLRSWEEAMSLVGEASAMRENARAAFINFTRASWLTITVIEANGAVVGWGAREELDENITDFWIDPAFQRQGLGTALLEGLEEQIIRQGFTVARLETHARNAQAVEFFGRHGYSISWLSTTYSPKLDSDVQSVGLTKTLVQEPRDTYGPDF